MRKFIRGLFIATAVTVGMGTTFTSCKDTDNDYQLEVNKGILDLKGQISLLETQLKNLEDAQKGCKDLCEAKQAELEAAIEALDTALGLLDQGKADKSTVEELQKKVTKLAGELATAQANYSTLQSEVTTLKQVIAQAATKEELDSINEDLREVIATLSTTIESNGEEAAKNLNDYKEKADSIMEDLQAQINDLSARCTVDCDSLKNAYLTFEGKVNTFMTSAQQSINSLNTTVSALTTMLSDYSTVKSNAATALSKALNNELMLANLSNTLQNLRSEFEARDKVFSDSLTILDTKVQKNIDDIQSLTTRMNNVDKDILALYGKVDTINDKIDAININIDSLTTRIGNAEATIIEHTAALKALNERVDQLINGLEARLDAMITSMNVEATYNPVFGTLSSPFGINSRFLMAYYGKTTRGDVDFPTASTALEYRDLEAPVLTSKDMQMLKPSVEQYGGTYVQGQDAEGNYTGNAGAIYFRLNPGNVDLEGKTFSLVNTLDKESVVKIENVQKCDKELRFGYTFGRSQETNGFYMAQATLAPEDVYKAKIEIEPGLKSAVGNVLKDIKNKNFTDMSDLLYMANLLFKQFDGILPALSLKSEWTYNDANGLPNATAVYTHSDIAATCFKPLGFGALYDQSFNKLPLFNPLTEFDQLINPNDFTINIKIDPIELKDANITIHLENVKLNDLGQITVTADVKDENGKVIGHLENVKVNSASFAEDIAAAVNKSIDGWNQEIANKLNNEINAIQSDIQNQVNDLLEKISGQINGSLKDMVDKLNNSFKDKFGSTFDHLNDFVKAYNQFASWINRFLANPNHYMQPIMLYKTDGYHIVSEVKEYPSIFHHNGGDAIWLYATTHNADIISPCFKKFVGVSNVWKTGDESVSAQNGDAAAKKLLDTANANKEGNVDTVFDGKQIHVVLPVPASAKGYTYEVVYQGLDYHGLTSTMKVWFSVVD